MHNIIKSLEEKYDAQVMYTSDDLSVLTSINLLFFKWITTNLESPVYPKWNKKWVIGKVLTTNKVDMDITNPASYGINLSILSEMDFYRKMVLDDILLLQLTAVIVTRSVHNKICVLNDLSGVRVQKCVPVAYLEVSQL
jgi:hypothetical protein